MSYPMAGLGVVGGAGRRAAVAVALAGLLCLLSPACAQTEDISTSANSTVPVVAATAPECGGCGAGQFLLKECDAEAPADQQCQRCRGCPLGTFQSGPCTATADTECSLCSLCDDAEVELKMCSNQVATGGDRVCGVFQEPEAVVPAATEGEEDGADAAGLQIDEAAPADAGEAEESPLTAPEAEAEANPEAEAGAGEETSPEAGAPQDPEEQLQEDTVEDTVVEDTVQDGEETTAVAVGPAEGEEAGEETDAVAGGPAEEEAADSVTAEPEQQQVVEEIPEAAIIATAPDEEEAVDEAGPQVEEMLPIAAAVNETAASPVPEEQPAAEEPMANATESDISAPEEMEEVMEAQPEAPEAVVPLALSSEAVAVEGTIVLTDMTIAEFTASGLGERMRTAVSDFTDLPLEQVRTGAVAAGSVAVEMIAVFGLDQEQQAVAFADQIRTQAPLVFVGDQELLIFGIEEKASGVDVKFATFGEILEDIQAAAELNDSQKPPEDGAPIDESAEEKSDPNEPEGFFKNLEAKTVSWWNSAPLWQQIVVPTGAALVLLAILSCVVATCCCCCRRRKKRSQEKKYSDPNYGLYADPRSSEPSYGPAFA